MSTTEQKPTPSTESAATAEAAPKMDAMSAFDKYWTNPPPEVGTEYYIAVKRAALRGFLAGAEWKESTAEELRAMLASERIRADRAEDALAGCTVATPVSPEEQAAINAERAAWEAECKAARREQQRTDFAGLAMQAIVAKVPVNLERTTEDTKSLGRRIALGAVIYADSLLAALEAPKS